MRLLANENVPGEAVDLLRARGHDIAWVREDSPGSDDNPVLSRAQAEEREPFSSMRIASALILCTTRPSMGRTNTSREAITWAVRNVSSGNCVH